MDSGQLLPPWVLQLIGIALIIAFSVHWWVTGKESALFVGVGVTLAFAGTLQGRYNQLQSRLYKGNAPEEQERAE